MLIRAREAINVAYLRWSAELHWGSFAKLKLHLFETFFFNISIKNFIVDDFHVQRHFMCAGQSELLIQSDGKV